MRFYILEGRKPKAVESILTFGFWFQTADRHVARTTIGPLDISTVFLGIDHNFYDETGPILFETMIFGFDENDSYQTRCSTWEEAEQMHARAVAVAETLVRNADSTLSGFLRTLKTVDC